MNFTEILQNLTKKPLADCTDQELYLALLELVRQKSADLAGVMLLLLRRQPDSPSAASY